MKNERNAGMRSWLSSAMLYRLFQRSVGGNSFGEWLAKNHWQVQPGMTVLDVGCGPAALRSKLPESLNYYGFDPNPDYISWASKYASGVFHLGVMETFLAEHSATLCGKVDTVICSGVLHHLADDQIEDVLAGASHLLKPGGRFVALEPVFSQDQSLVSRWVVKQDRGTNVKSDHEWLQMLKQHFPDSQVKVVHGKLRIPYTHGLLNAIKKIC